MNSIQIVGIIGLFAVSNFIWYWQGWRDGRRVGYASGRNINRSAFWKE
jgi:hypothetical protein